MDLNLDITMALPLNEEHFRRSTGTTMKYALSVGSRIVANTEIAMRKKCLHRKRIAYSDPLQMKVAGTTTI
jgi:hypothetical protein